VADEYGASGEDMAPWGAVERLPMELTMSQQHFRFDASRSVTALEQDSTIIAVIEMSQTKWLVAALVPGVERQPLKVRCSGGNAAEAFASLALRSRQDWAQHQAYRRCL